MASQSAITFPPHFTPGTTSAFVSNETIALNITSTQIWALLANISKWPSYYKNCARITPPDSGSGTFLHTGDVFHFSTFGFPPLRCEVVESEAPESNGRAGRLAWRCKTEEGLEVYHAWLVEDLEGQRVRVLTQESQIGPVFEQWDKERPNKMCKCLFVIRGYAGRMLMLCVVLGHQDWLDGLVTAAKGAEVGKTNLEAIDFPVRQLGENGFA
jgi:hypothetical protein